MSALGKLVVSLSLNYAEFTQGLSKSDQAALKFAANNQRVFDQAARSSKQFFAGMASQAGAAVLAVVGINSVIGRLNTSLDTLANIADAAEKTGSSVANLSKIQQAAAQFGHAFDPLETSISRLAKGMATVDGESNKVNRALATLEIKSKDAAGNVRDAGEVTIEVVKKLQEYEDSANKNAIATALWGKEGADLLPKMNDVASVIDKVRGYTDEEAKAADALKNQFAGLGNQVDLAFISLASDLMPALKTVTGALTNTTKGTSAFNSIAKFTVQAFKDIVVTGAAAGFLFMQLGKTVETAASQLLSLAKLDLRAVRTTGTEWATKLAQDWEAYQKFATDIQLDSAAITESVEAAAEGPKKKLKFTLGGDGEEAKKIAALNEASAKYLETLKSETLAVGRSTIQTKLLGVAKQAAVTPSHELALAIMAEGQAWARLSQFQEEAKEEFAALEEREEVFRDVSRSIQEYSRATDIANESAQFELSMLGKSALERDVAIEQRRAELELKRRILEITERVTDAEDRESLIEEANAIGAKDRAAARLSAIAKNRTSEWSGMFSSMEQTGRLVFANLLGHGTSSFKAIGEALKASVIDLLFQLTAKKWIISIGTSITGSLMSGAANASGNGLMNMITGASSGGGMGNLGGLMNIASGARSLFSAFSGGASSLMTAIGTSAIGQSLGLGVAGGSALGAGVGIGGAGAGAGAGTAFIGGAGTALGGTGATAAGLSGMGAMMAAAAGPLAIAAAADMIFRLIAGNKVIKGAEALTYVPVIGPLINMLFGMGPKKLGPAELTGNFSDAGFSGEFQADWTRKAGFLAFGKKKGRRGLGISEEQAAALSAMVTDISVPFNELTKKTGDAKRSLAGWTFEVRRAIETEEQQEALTKDLTNSIGAKLIPELTLMQQKGETLADTAGRASAEFALMTSTIDLTGQTFGKTGLASLGLRDSLVQIMGGLQAAASALEPYFANFYSDAERSASGWRVLNGEMSRLGINSLPTTREGFRALVEAQDLSTASGQKMFASLIALAPAFAKLTEEAEAAKAAITLLTTESFTTLVDYTRYIRLAANAGVAPKPADIYQPDGSALGGTTAAASNAAILEELRQIRSEQQAGDIAVATATTKMASILAQWNGDGMPDIRDIAA